MRILSLQCVGVEGVRDGEYAFADSTGGPADVVVVSGPAASGKTRLLELLLLVRNIVAPTNEETDEDPWVRLGGRSARAVVTFWLDENERQRLGYPEPAVVTEVILGADPDLVAEFEPDPGLAFLFERYDHTGDTIKFEYFGENRRLDVGGGSISLAAASQGRFRTSKDPRKFAFVPDFLASLKRDATRAQRFEETLTSFAPSCSFDPSSGLVSSVGRTASGVEQLSASERDAVMFSAVSSLVTFSQSVIFVDRPDLYIRDEARVFRGLSSFGVSNQLFVTGYSAELFRAAESRCVISLA